MMRTTPPAEKPADDCMDVYFQPNHATSLELAPTDSVFSIKVYRPQANKADTAAVPLVVKNGTENFNVPPTALFAAGDTVASVTVGVKSTAPVGKSMPLDLAIEDAEYVNPYTANLALYSCSILIVKWNMLGNGQFIDGLTIPGLIPITIEQRDDNPAIYRISNPYTDENLQGIPDVAGWFPGATQDYIIFTVADNGQVTWNTYWLTDLLYNGQKGADILAFLPSKLKASMASSDALSKVVYGADKSIQYFTLTPYFYANANGPIGPETCYVGFPGVDMSGLLKK